MRYRLNHDYAASRDGRTFGPWAKGDEIELDDPADAEWVERDSPGALTEVKPKDGGERQQQPAADRQHRGGRNR